MVAVSTQQFTGEGAGCERRIDGIAHQTAVVASAAEGAMDGDVAAHVLERDARRPVAAHHPTGIGVGGVDVARGLQVLNGGTVCVAEGTAEALGYRLLSGADAT